MPSTFPHSHKGKEQNLVSARLPKVLIIPNNTNLDMELFNSSESSVMDETSPDTEETLDKLAGTMFTANKLNG